MPNKIFSFTVKPVLSDHSKTDKTKDLQTDAGIDPGFLERGFKFTRGLDLLISPDILLIFCKILHENEIILSH